MRVMIGHGSEETEYCTLRQKGYKIDFQLEEQIKGILRMSV
jgi:hypothetical protein